MYKVLHFQYFLAVTCSASTVNNAIPDKTTIDINTNVEYACDTGYTHSSGSLTRTCTTGGILSGEDPICTCKSNCLFINNMSY